MEQILEQIRDFADHAHDTQMRKYSSERYIAHPVRVMNLCRIVSNELSVLACALLHDVLEDTPISEQELFDFLLPLLGNQSAAETLNLVKELTDVYVKRDYPKLNRRARKAREAKRLKSISPLAQSIKYADILDNCLEIGLLDNDFAAVFLRECMHLLQVMDKGDSSIRKKAIKVIEKNLKLIKI